MPDWRYQRVNPPNIMSFEFGNNAANTTPIFTPPSKLTVPYKKNVYTSHEQ